MTGSKKADQQDQKAVFCDWSASRLGGTWSAISASDWLAAGSPTSRRRAANQDTSSDSDPFCGVGSVRYQQKRLPDDRIRMHGAWVWCGVARIAPPCPLTFLLRVCDLAYFLSKPP
jgi:hypothetical protein